MLLVIGGGQVGCYHAGRLRRAVAAGRLEGPIVVVDRERRAPARERFENDPLIHLALGEWQAYLGEWLGRADDADHLIPAPLAPHLLWSWLADELGAEGTPAPAGWGLPYEMVDGSGARFLSAAAWRCPATCVEPRHCPALHAPRDWDLATVIEQGAIARGFRPAVFRCLHLAEGVGSIPAGEVLAARRRLADRGAPILVATSSRCHAAIGALAYTFRPATGA